MKDLIQKALRDPSLAFGFLVGKIAPQFFIRQSLKSFYGVNIGESVIVLSFDCDTYKDIDVVGKLHEQLVCRQISASYAIPGELLLEGFSEYAAVRAAGAEIINHGYKSHTVLHGENNYVSTLFYDQLSSAEWKADILYGHETIMDLFGHAPVGFRTPHFGTFQGRKRLRELHAYLAELGYQYSTSTTPTTALLNGTIWRSESGIFELPVAGCYSQPARILDSFGFRYSHSRDKDMEKNYLVELSKLINFVFEQDDGLGVINIYVDPSQVFDWPMFYDALDLIAERRTSTYSELINEVELV